LLVAAQLVVSNLQRHDVQRIKEFKCCWQENSYYTGCTKETRSRKVVWALQLPVVVLTSTSVAESAGLSSKMYPSSRQNMGVCTAAPCYCASSLRPLLLCATPADGRAVHWGSGGAAAGCARPCASVRPHGGLKGGQRQCVFGLPSWPCARSLCCW